MKCTIPNCGAEALYLDQVSCGVVCQRCKAAALEKEPGHPFQALPASVVGAPEQLYIDDHNAPDAPLELPTNGASTSGEAAKAMREPMRGVRRRIYNHIAAQGARGATCFEVETALQLEHQTASAAISTMANTLQCLKDGGHRRATQSGQAAIAWVIATASKEPEQ